QDCGFGLCQVALAVQQAMCAGSCSDMDEGWDDMRQVNSSVMLRLGRKMVPVVCEDIMHQDGLTDAFNDCHMGISAENIAETYGIDRQAQDEFACQSQQKCRQSMAENRIQHEIVPVTIQAGKERRVVEKDEAPRPSVDFESLAK